MMNGNYWFLKAVVCQGFMYFFSENNGVFMRYAIGSNNVEVIRLKPTFDYRGAAVLCSDERKGYVYAVIESGNSIMQYNVYSREIEHFRINHGDDLLHLNAKAIYKNSEIIIYPRMANKIIRWNPGTNTVQEENIKDALSECRGIYYASNEDNASFDIIISNESHECKIYDMDKTLSYSFDFKMPVLSISVRDVQSMFVLSQNGYIYRCSFDGLIERVDGFIHEGENSYFSTIHYTKNKLWLMPGEGEDIVYIDVLTGKSYIFDEYPDDFSYIAPKHFWKYTTAIVYNNNCYFSAHSGNYIFYIDENSGEGHWLSLHWPDSKKILEAIQSRSNNFFFEGEISLNDYIGFI